MVSAADLPPLVCGWVAPERAWPEGMFDAALVERLDGERIGETHIAVPAWLRDPTAAAIAIDLLAGASEEFDCSSWGYGVELVVETARRVRPTGEAIAPIEGNGVTIDADWIRAIGELCQHAGGWPTESRWLGDRLYFLFESDDVPMLWEVESERRETAIRKQMRENQRLCLSWEDERRRHGLAQIQERWLRLLLETHGEDRRIARCIDRGETWAGRQ